jgi:SAM-dependent methyltransferase
MATSFLKSLFRKVPLAAPTYHWLRRQKALLGLRRDFRTFAALARSRPARLPLNWADRLPCLDDRTATTGFDRHYVYHTAWAARVLARTRPASHVDISSLLYFGGIVSAFLPVQFYDYRPADLKLSNLTTGAVDLTSLPFGDRSIESLSCMHVVEHIGLGRYGDPLDPDGDLKAMSELARVLAPGGSLLYVVPVGKPLVRFNGCRIYAVEQVVSSFGELELAEFALIPDDPALGGLVVGAAKELADAQDYGCGCFWFRRAR